MERGSMKDQSTVNDSVSTPKSRVKLKQQRIFYIAAAIAVLLLTILLLRQRQLPITQNASVDAQQQVLPPIQGEEEFVLQMIPHHQEAIDSSRYLSENTENVELKEFADTLVNDQTKELWTMVGFYQLWFKKQYTGNASYVKTMPNLTQLSGDELDKAYIRGMIDHHTASIQMAESLMQITEKEELKTLARQVIDGQTTKITQLKTWYDAYQK